MPDTPLSTALRPPAVHRLGDPACHDAAIVGGKAANLSRLAADYPVPPGFCLTTAAFDCWAGAADRPGLLEVLAAAYADLADRCGRPDPSVAVRSSAVDEDGRLASFAGQHDTFLNVVGPAGVAEAVARCWASARSERALDYRRRHGLSPDGVRVGVLVQQLVPADQAGVVFSLDPVTGRRDVLVVNACWGLGESVVAGTTAPDSYVVRTSDLAILERAIAEKRRMTVITPGGTREVDVPRLLRAQSALTDEQVAEIARLARSLESRMGWPVDAEWALAAERLYLLQCRPVTTEGGG